MTRFTIKAMAALAAVATTSPAFASLSTEFDLVCKGVETLKTGEPGTAWNERFRFDLNAKRWCRGKCTTAASIGEVTEDRIVLSDSRASTGGVRDAELYFSRTDGKVREYITTGWGGRTLALAEGTCERAYFSELPGKKF